MCIVCALHAGCYPDTAVCVHTSKGEWHSIGMASTQQIISTCEQDEFVLHVHVCAPYSEQLIFLRKSDCLVCAVLPCLNCCLFDLACVFLPSFSSLIKTCKIVSPHVHVHVYTTCISYLLCAADKHVQMKFSGRQQCRDSYSHVIIDMVCGLGGLTFHG